MMNERNAYQLINELFLIIYKNDFIVYKCLVANNYI